MGKRRFRGGEETVSSQGKGLRNEETRGTRFYADRKHWGGPGARRNDMKVQLGIMKKCSGFHNPVRHHERGQAQKKG